MDKFLKIFARKAKGINLLPEEKSRIRGALLSYINSRPAKEQVAAGRSFWASLSFSNLKYAPVLSALLILLSGAGITAAAEGSLPGDTLYPVKVRITENARAVLSLSQEKKAAWEIERADRRLREVEKLAVKGELEVENVAEAEAGFKKHVKSANDIAVRIRGNSGRGSSKIQSDLKTVLIVHEDILGRMRGRDDDGDGESEIEMEVEGLHGEISDSIRDAAESLRSSEDDIRSSSGSDVKQAAEGKLSAAENKLSELDNFIAGREDKISAEVLAEARKLSAETKDTIIKGRAKIDAGAYGEAFVLFQKSIRLSQAAQQLVSISSSLPEIRQLNGSVIDFSERIKSSEIEEDGEEDDSSGRSGHGNGGSGSDDRGSDSGGSGKSSE